MDGTKKMKKMNEENRKIISNKAKCTLCGHIVESKHIHDFRSCSCGNIHVDGGLEYLKRGVRGDWDTLVDLSEYEENK